MLRATAALFGTIFLPLGISFFFVLHHRHWREGIGTVAAALGFLYVAWRANDLLGLDEIRNTAGMALPEPPAVTRAPEPPPAPEPGGGPDGRDG